jgi:hypothetical protein
MAAPAPSTKWQKKAGPTKGERLSTNKTAAIEADRARTAAQTAPGTDYKAKKAAQKAAGGGAYYGRKKESREEKAAKRKKRLAKMASMTAEARERRKARSPMPTMGGR